jgi:hypothetical protein
VSDISFQVTNARAEAHAALPTIVFGLQVESPGDVIHSVALHCQIRIEPQRRRYSAAEEERLLELFGETPRWGDTLKPFLWTHVATTVGSFVATTEVDLPVTCTYDFEVAGSKYLHGLENGEIPLLLLFSGTAFVRSDAGFTAAPVSATLGISVFGTSPCFHAANAFSSFATTSAGLTSPTMAKMALFGL